MVALPKQLVLTFPVPQLLVWQKEKRTLFGLKIPVKYNCEGRYSYTRMSFIMS